MDMRAIDAGSEHVITISSEATLAEAADVMHEETVGCLVVVDGKDRVVGIVTDRDLCLRVVASDRPDQHLCAVRTVMTSPVHTVQQDATVADAVALMRGLGVRRLPICRGDVPVGMIALDDVTEALATGLIDLETGVQNRREEEARKRRVDHALTRLGGLRERMRAVGWHAREEFLEDLDRLEDLILGRRHPS